MFSGRWDTNLGRDMNGRVLLDFKPALLLPLLDYLRAKRIETPEHLVPLPDVPSPLQEDFFRMIKYFGLEDHVLQRHIAWHWENTEKEISTTLSVDKLEIIFGHWSAPVFGSTSFSSGIHSWAVQVTTSSGDNDLMCAIGIGTPRTPKSGCQPYDRAVFYQPDVDGGAVKGASSVADIRKASPGDIIGCKLTLLPETDASPSTLIFYLNGEQLCQQVTVAALADGPYIPFIAAWGTTKVRLISTFAIQ